MTRRAKPITGKSRSVQERRIEPQSGPAPVGVPKHVAAPIALALAALALIAFAPVLGNGFVDLDDFVNILDDHAFRGLGWPQVVTAFTTPRMGIYQPLASLLLSAEYVTCGLDPAGYHRTSLVVHALNAVVLYGLILALVGRWKPALVRAHPGMLAGATGLAVAWFVAHPARTEPVAWVSAQLYLPCALFAMLSVRAYLHAHSPGVGRRSRPWLAGSYALALIAMLFMPGAVCLPFLFLILDASLLDRLASGAGSTAGRIGRAAGLVAEKLPLLLPATALMGAAYWARRSSQVVKHLEYDSVWARLAQAAYGVWFYLVKMVAPFGLSAFYPRPEGGDFRAPIFGVAVIGLVVFSVGVVALRKRVPWLAAVWAAYLLVLAPHLGLIRVGYTIAADRYCYLASILWVIPLAGGLAWLGQRSWPTRTRFATVAAGLALVAGIASLSRTQARTWHNSEALWLHALKWAPGSSQTHVNYATALGEKGDLAAAVTEFDRALAIWPKDADTLVKRGSSLAGQGRFDEAIASYRAALELRPDDAMAYLNLGAALAGRGEYDEAIVQYRKSLSIQPDRAQASVNLGTAYLRQRKLDEATAAFQEALRLEPWNAEAHASLGAVLAMQGKLDGAIAEYQEALREDPDQVPALVNLGIALAQSGRPGEAVATLGKAVRLQPGNADAHFALGATLAGLGRLADAIAEFNEALRLNPGHAQAARLLAMARGQRGGEPSGTSLR
jgi:tetratricopeptide (TPR) repeat protein